VPNPHPISAGTRLEGGNPTSRVQEGLDQQDPMLGRQAQWDTMRRLAAVSAGVLVCGCHGGYAAAVRKGLRGSLNWRLSGANAGAGTTRPVASSKHENFGGGLCIRWRQAARSIASEQAKKSLPTHAQAQRDCAARTALITRL
jgi:hypothetical protein